MRNLVLDTGESGVSNAIHDAIVTILFVHPVAYCLHYFVLHVHSFLFCHFRAPCHHVGALGMFSKLAFLSPGC